MVKELILKHLSESIGWILLAMGYSVSGLSLLYVVVPFTREKLTIDNALPYLGIGCLWGVLAMLWNFDVRRK